MSNYQVFARKYRPQTFAEVVGQEAIVTTLKNAIRNKRLGHAYLFCGSRGTGKTTLARVFAKALNCEALSSDGEPCNTCSSCKEITTGHSLDVLEIDAASHRGIDDVRQINDTVGYATSSGGYKIYIIDEVHMLTKEAFNALLKTLEEPPAKVMFLFATTEPHKMPATILSRCQRFNLSRIPLDKMMDKLQQICTDLGVSIDGDALRLIAGKAEGGLRDAESLLDQIISFHEGAITLETVTSILGVMSKECLFALDQAGKEGRLSMAFELAHQIFTQGKDFVHFVETLTEHFRTLLMVKLAGKTIPLHVSEAERIKYEASAKLYTQEQCVDLLDFLIEAQNKIRFMTSSKIALEAILLRILRIHQRLPVEYLVRRLTEIEQAFSSQQAAPSLASETPPESRSLSPIAAVPSTPFSAPPPIRQAPAPSPLPPKPQPMAHTPSESVDPTPSLADLGMQRPNRSAPPPKSIKEQSRHDTLMQFAAVELEGTIKKF